MHAVALANIKAYSSSTQRCRNVFAIRADATQFPLPPQPTVLFLANPFNGPVMAEFVRHVERSLRAHPRPVYVIYRQARCADMWDASPYFARTHTTDMYTCWRTR